MKIIDHIYYIQIGDPSKREEIERIVKATKEIAGKRKFKIGLRSEKMTLDSGWEIVCPDGLVRHFAYHNEGDAQCDAEVFSDGSCRAFPTPNPLEELLPPCPSGLHTTRPVVFSEPSMKDGNRSS